MKKIFIAPLSIMSIAILLTGCTKGETTITVAKNLDSNLNSLTSIVTKLDTLDNDYISTPDLQMARPYTTTAQDGKVYSLAYNSNDNNQMINDLIKQLLYNKLSERLTKNSNGNCRICNNHYDCDQDGFCNSCNNKIITDNMGNCTNCGRHLNLTNNNTCANCNSSAVLSESSCSKAVTRLSGVTDKELSATRLSTSNIINNIKQDKNALDTTSEFTPILLANETNDTSVNEPQQYKFNKDNLRYKPRHVKDIDTLDIADQINNYLVKIQKLYAMSNDAIEANTTLNECKNTLLDTVKEVKELNKEVINGTCVPSNNQLQALKNYIV